MNTHRPLPILAAAFACVLTLAPVSSLPAYGATPAGFEELSEKLLPTVVNISTTTRAKELNQEDLPQLPELPEGTPFDQFFKEFYDQFRNIPQQQREKTNALGSGFIIDAKNGYIVTNNHVIKGADEIKVILHDNTSLDAELVGMDDKTDLALLKVSKTDKLVDTKWGDSDKARVGSWVIAIGNPFGLGGTVTAGIVSARQRDISAGPYDDFIQTDASINRGNSGGPMFNTAGEVVGVNTAIFSPSGGSVGIGFAVPSNLAKGIVDQLIKYGETRRGWIGVRIQEVTPEIAESLGLDRALGAMIASVTPDGPAEKAGLKAGDVILSFDGKDVESMRSLPRIVAETEVNTKAPITVWRKGKKITANITLGQLEKAEQNGLLEEKAEDGTPPAVANATEIPQVGLKLAPLDGGLRESHGIPDNVKGVVIVDIKRDSAADEKDLLPGDVIVEVDQQEVSSPADVAAKVTEAEKAGRASVLFFVARKDDMRFVALKLKK